MAKSEVQRSEWAIHWPLLLTCFLGLSFPSIAIHSTGVLIEPLTKEFGWTRAQVSAGVTLSGLLTIPLAPLVGALIDRWGIRRIALPGSILAGGALAMLAAADGSFAQWLILWGIYGFAAILVKPTVWTFAISGAFDKGRSLALAIALTGNAFTAAITPPLALWIADTYGWRQVYPVLAVVCTAPLFLLSIFCLYGVHERRNASAAMPDQAPAPELTGLTRSEAIRSVPLIRIGLSTLITLCMASSLVVHKVPILTAAGVARDVAAQLTGLSGAAALLGIVVTGWLMGKRDGGNVGASFNLLMALALVLLLDPFRTPVTIVISMLVVGFAGGTQLQICAFLTSKYAGMRNYGKIFGVMSSAIAVGGALGPSLAGLAYDLSGSYTILILIEIPAGLLASLLLFRLGPVPNWDAAEKR